MIPIVIKIPILEENLEKSLILNRFILTDSCDVTVTLYLRIEIEDELWNENGFKIAVPYRRTGVTTYPPIELKDYQLKWCLG